MAVDPQIALVLTAATGFTENLIRKVVLDVVANLRKAGVDGGTPVDTGWARANWIPSHGGDSPTTPAGSKLSVGVAEAALQAGIGSLLSYKLLSGPVYVTNNVPYILRLNDGSSTQAAKGFVQAAITAAVVSSSS